MDYEVDENSEPRYSDELDSLDSSVFTGEMLYCNINEFEWYVKRWQRAIDRHREFCNNNEN